MSAQLKGFPPAVIGNRIEAKYLCSQCRNILRNPVQSFCGHRFCRACVENLLRGGERVLCPSCVQEQHEDEELLLEQVFPDNATKRELYALPAVCPNEGCQWDGTLKEFEKHEKVCEYRLEQCQCGQQFRPEDYATHLTNDCTYRLISCPHCHAKIQFRQHQAHNEECPRLPVACPRCGEENILRSNLKAHMTTKGCKPRIRCPYGCGTMVENALLDDHLRTMPRLHLDAVGRTVSALTERVDRGLSELQSAVTVLTTARGAGADEEEGMETGEASGGEGLHHQLGALEQKVNMSEQFGIVLKRELEKTSRHLQDLKEERRVDRERIEALEAGMHRLLGGGLPVAVASAQLVEAPISTDGTLIWKITEFRQKKEDAAAGIRMVLTSPPFYTSPRGYKLCARIYPNGDGVGRNSHMSVFLVIMKGPYDALLKWPFRQKVTLALQDQGPRNNHIVDSFRPDPSSNSYHRPLTEINTASGCPMFAKQVVIWQEGEFQYVKDDAIFLKVSVDTTGL